MTKKEKLALENDKRELMELINPAHVAVRELPLEDGCTLRLLLDVTGIVTSVCTRDNSAPHWSDSIQFHIDCYSGYPASKVRVYYGGEKWPSHVNVYPNADHVQCIAGWGRYSSIASAARKTLQVVAFDPAVVNFGSMANSNYKDFMEKNAAHFPCTDLRMLLRPNTGGSRCPRAHV